MAQRPPRAGLGDGDFLAVLLGHPGQRGNSARCAALARTGDKMTSSLARLRVLARQAAAPLIMHGADRLSVLHWELGIRARDVTLTPQDLAPELVVWESHRMTPLTRTRWLNLRAAAADESVTLLLISAFRDWDQQAEKFRCYLRSGKSPQRVMRRVAPPGYSEHHTGRALDLTCPECLPGGGHFAETEAYHWLCQRAKEFGFAMSYPRGNPLGIRFEPWHWCALREDASGPTEVR